MRIATKRSGGVFYFCPGCNQVHMVAVDKPFENGARWTFNGNLDKPTFTPSVNVGPKTSQQCHHFVTDGRIQFLGDCWHQLKGKTVDLPPVPQWLVDEETEWVQ